MNSCFEIVGDYQSENKKIFDPHKVFEVLEKNKSSHFEQLGIPATQKYARPKPVFSPRIRPGRRVDWDGDAILLP